MSPLEDYAEDIMRKLLESENVRVIKKSDSLLMRFIGVFSRRFTASFWTTYRLPFCRPVIAHPDSVRYPYLQVDVLGHEIVHCMQFKPWYGPYVMLLMATLLPLPVFFSGRWLYIERRAYLRDIKAGRCSVDQAVDTLWNGYLWPWPKTWMCEWFEKQLKGTQMIDSMVKATSDLAQDMANEVLTDINKQGTAKGKGAAFQSWVIWRLAVLQTTLDALCHNVEFIEAQGRKGEWGTDPEQENVTQ